LTFIESKCGISSQVHNLQWGISIKMNDNGTITTRKFLDRIFEMYNSGLSSEEIAIRILTFDMETVEFYLEAMVEIIIKYGSQYPVSKKNEK